MYLEMIGFAPAQASTPLALPPSLDPDMQALTLDFDGTIVDIADTPDSVVVAEDLGPLLNGLHDRMNGRLAILTGRSVEEIEHFVPEFKGDIIGWHGAQGRIDGVTRDRVDPLPDHNATCAAARAFCDIHPTLLFEPKRFGCAVHYRAAPELEPAVRAFFDGIATPTDGFTVCRAKMAYEIKPRGTDKGTALKDLMTIWGDQRTPIHIGDDVSDEDAFASAEKLGGFGIAVGNVARQAT